MQTNRIMRRIAVIALTVGAGLAACGRGGAPAGPPPPPPPTPVPPPVRLYYDYGGGIRDSVRQVIRDEATLSRVWQQATAPQSSPPPVPTLDFERQMAVLVAAGRMTPEDEIHVDSLQLRMELVSDSTQVEVLHIFVGTVRGCGRFRSDAFPLEIVGVRRFDGPLRWQETRRQTNCGGERGRP